MGWLLLGAANLAFQAPLVICLILCLEHASIPEEPVRSWCCVLIAGSCPA